MTDDNINRINWKSFTNAIDLIIENGGKIFGGAVRDMIARDIAARRFIQWRSEQENNFRLFYTDLNNHPSSSDRVIMPKDIDAVIHHSKLENLITNLKKNKFQVKLKWMRDAKNYLPNINVPVGTIQHHRYVICPKTTLNFKELSDEVRSLINTECRAAINIINNMTSNIQKIIIDLMVIMNDEKYDPPFGNLDFECNGLILTKYGIRLCSYLNVSLTDTPQCRKCDPILIQAYIEKIKKDIVNKIAHPILKITENTYPMEYRIEKMKSKGYTIELVLVNKVTEDIVPNSDGSHPSTCIICHGDLLKDDHYKLNCCDARYHSKCLVNACFIGHLSISQTHRCIMCRRDVPPLLIPEINVLRNENNLIEEELDIEEIRANLIIIDPVTPAQNEILVRWSLNNSEDAMELLQVNNDNDDEIDSGDENENENNS